MMLSAEVVGVDDDVDDACVDDDVEDNVVLERKGVIIILVRHN